MGGLGDFGGEEAAPPPPVTTLGGEVPGGFAGRWVPRVEIRNLDGAVLEEDQGTVWATRSPWVVDPLLSGTLVNSRPESARMTRLLP